jgi:hypothetical protein
MLAIRRTHRLAIAYALACALLASATSGPAFASVSADSGAAAARAQERYYSSFGEPQPIASSGAAALAQERYYASYGEPEPLTVPQSPAPSDDTPSLPIALSIAVSLGLAAAVGATQLRRLRIRRRAERVTA